MLRVRPGFSLLELLVAIGVVGLLAAILAPAITHVREAARRAECGSHLHQLGTAIHAYEAVHGILPPGTTEWGSTHVSLLPYLEQKSLSDRYAQVSLPRIEAMLWRIDQLGKHRLDILGCPSDPQSGRPSEDFGMYATNYAGNSGGGVQKYGYNGLFHSLSSSPSPNYPQLASGPVRLADVTDGLSQTAAMAEILAGSGYPVEVRAYRFGQPRYSGTTFDQFVAECRGRPMGEMNAFFRGLPWSDGAITTTRYTHTLPPNGPSCNHGEFTEFSALTAGSLHPGGVQVLFADVSVTFVSESISLDVWRAVGSRNGADRGLSR